MNKAVLDRQECIPFDVHWHFPRMYNAWHTDTCSLCWSIPHPSTTTYKHTTRRTDTQTHTHARTNTHTHTHTHIQTQTHTSRARLCLVVLHVTLSLCYDYSFQGPSIHCDRAHYGGGGFCMELAQLELRADAGGSCWLLIGTWPLLKMSSICFFFQGDPLLMRFGWGARDVSMTERQLSYIFVQPAQQNAGIHKNSGDSNNGYGQWKQSSECTITTQ